MRLRTRPCWRPSYACNVRRERMWSTSLVDDLEMESRAHVVHVSVCILAADGSCDTATFLSAVWDEPQPSTSDRSDLENISPSQGNGMSELSDS